MAKGHGGRSSSGKVVLLSFLAAAFFYAAVASILGGYSFTRSVIGGFLWAAIFLPIFLWSMRRLDRSARANRGFSSGGDALVSRQVNVGWSPGEVLDAVQIATERLPRAKVVNSENDELHIRVGMSFRSWGERLHVVLSPLDDGTLVRVTSRPLLGMTLFDYGKGEENVRHIIDCLDDGAPGR